MFLLFSINLLRWKWMDMNHFSNMNHRMAFRCWRINLEKLPQFPLLKFKIGQFLGRVVTFLMKSFFKSDFSLIFFSFFIHIMSKFGLPYFPTRVRRLMTTPYSIIFNYLISIIPFAPRNFCAKIENKETFILILSLVASNF